MHISQLAPNRTEKVEDVVKIGDEVMVKVMEIDGQGRLNLSRKALMGGGTGNGEFAPRGPRTPRDSGPRDSGPRDSTPRDSTPRDAGPRDSGPRDSTPRDAGPRDAAPSASAPGAPPCAGAGARRVAARTISRY